MYKAKLQELCHQKKWSLPEYEVEKQGLDHCPSFRSTVTVNGVSFPSPSPAKSVKEAHNESARLALDYFSSPRPLSPSPPVPASPPAVNISGAGAVLPVNEEELDLPHLHNGTTESVAVSNADADEDMQHLYKSQLQKYTQKKGLTLPAYHYERFGPSHASRFRCTVTVGDQEFQCQDSFPKLSDAEHAAAKAALMLLSPDGVQGDEALYKNLLQEWAQKEGFKLPIYTTIRSGEAHMPTFLSTVDVEGQVFTGPEAKSKKQAEMSAARIAYTTFKRRETSQSISSPSPAPQGHQAIGLSNPSPAAPSPAAEGQGIPSPVPTYQGQDVGLSCPSPNPALHKQEATGSSLQKQESIQLLSSSLQSHLIAYLQQNVQPEMPLQDGQGKDRGDISGATPLPDRQAEDRVIHVVGSSTHTTSTEPECSFAATSVPSSSGLSIHCLPDQPLPSSSRRGSNSLPNTCIVEHLDGISASTSERIVVYPRETNMIHPPGSIVLPMSDDTWVAVKVKSQSQPVK